MRLIVFQTHAALGRSQVTVNTEPWSQHFHGDGDDLFRAGPGLQLIGLLEMEGLSLSAPAGSADMAPSKKA